VFVVFECCSFMFVWVVRGKLDSGIGTCRFSVNTYVNIIVLSMYTNVQVIYCIVFFSRLFELEVLIYLVDFF